MLENTLVYAGGVLFYYPTEKVRPTFVNYRHGIVMLLDGYTYSKSTRLNWYCSRRVSCGCDAKVKLTSDEKYIERVVYTHDHLKESYVVSNSGNLIKLN